MTKRTEHLNSEAYNIGYEDGRKDQRKADIEKACEWFRKENSHAVQEYLDHECEKLRKYMEE